MVKRLKNYINGKWVESKAENFLPVENPATGETLAEVPMSTQGELDEAVAAAKKAFESWRMVPAMKRVQPLFKLKELVDEHLEDLARCLTTDHGKVYREAYLEMGRTIDNIEVGTGMPTLMQGEFLTDINENIDEQFTRVPLGVFGVISAFNFPTMISFWFIPYATATGNTCIIKPSEITPTSVDLVFQLMDKAGFPPGVISLVHGDRDVADAMIKHPDIAGISSVTSTPVARSIYKTAAEYGKRVQCQAGAKNFAVVMPDADLDSAIPNIIKSVYGNTGQRCLAISNVVGVGDIYAPLRDRIMEEAKKIRVGNGLDESVTMGPVVTAAAKQRILGLIEKGVEEGTKLTLDGRDVSVEGCENGHFIGPCIFEDVTPEMTVGREEIFGPVLSLWKAKDLEQAIGLVNTSRYGNSAILYTESGKNARKFHYDVDCGNIGVNIGVAAPIACFPFCGMKDSFFGDIHGQSKDAINFFTHKKVLITRWY